MESVVPWSRLIAAVEPYCVGRQGNRAARQVREHGGAVGQAGGSQGPDVPVTGITLATVLVQAMVQEGMKDVVARKVVFWA